MTYTPEVIQRARLEFPGEKLVVDRTREEAYGGNFPPLRDGGTARRPAIVFLPGYDWHPDCRHRTLAVVDNHFDCVFRAMIFIANQKELDFIPVGVVHNYNVPSEVVVDVVAEYATQCVVDKPEYVHDDCPECNKAHEKEQLLIEKGVDVRLTSDYLRVSECQNCLEQLILTFTIKPGSKVLPPSGFTSRDFVEVSQVERLKHGKVSYKILHPGRPGEEVGWYPIEKALIYKG